MAKIGVIIFPGSNCDHDAIYAFCKILKQEVIPVWHKERDLQNCDVIVIPGGFSYGDYLRAGALARFSPVMQSIIEFAGNGGKVLGICNGFQVLCESGLLPGALLVNSDRLFSSKNIFLSVQNYDTSLTRLVPPGKILKMPIAHGEGRYYADKATLLSLNENRQIILRYCNEHGEITSESNPNGSLENIAGICNKEGNVFGLMPHPERACDATLSNEDGQWLLRSLITDSQLINGEGKVTEPVSVFHKNASL
jgi:phosphoribosylformylglycinamidine synthase